MASFKFRIKDAKAVKPTSIYLEFDDSVHNAKLYIGETVHPKQWDVKKGMVNKTYPAFADQNAKLKRIKAGTEAIHTKLTSEGKFTKDKLKNSFTILLAEINGKTVSNVYGLNMAFENLTDFIPHYIQSVTKTKGASTIGSYNQTLEVLRGYETANRRRITFESITIDFYNDYVSYMNDELEFAKNTVGKHVKNLKAFLNEATERGINRNLAFRSKKFQTLSEDVDNIYLTENELDKIFKLDCTENKRLGNARDLFLIGCYTGLRFSDFSQLTKANCTIVQNVECVTIQAQKTGERVTIPLHPKVKAILKRYEDTATGFPRQISNANLNYYIKEIGELAKINDQVLQYKGKGKLRVETTKPKFELIGTHTARRSYATNAFLSGLDSLNIMWILSSK
jgi:site-specific recombinase XerD